MSLTSPERVGEVQEALWELERKFGPVLPNVADQVAVARTLAAIQLHPKPADIYAAFASIGVSRPTRAYVVELSAKLSRRVERRDLLDLILDFRQYALGALSRQFGGKTKGREDELRDYLRTYLTPRGYAEAEAGTGNTDLLIPSVPAIIETKVWDTVERYQAGLEQLRRYIHTEKPRAAYMVMSGDRVPLPSIVNDHEQAIGDEPILSGVKVPIVVVAFEVDYPSKARQETRRRERHGR